MKMNDILKRFVAWAISSKGNFFRHARLQLTAYYTLSIIGLLVIFNIAVYTLFGSSIFDTPEEKAVDQALSEEQRIVEAAQDRYSQGRLRMVLYQVDALTILLVAILSYSLAGKTLAPIESMYRKQKKFIADAAHELRTPLAVMKTGAEVLLRGEATARDYKKLIEESVEEVNLLSHMVDDLLFLAQHDNEKAVVFAEVDVQQLVKKQITFMQSYALSHSVTLSEHTQDGCLIRGNAVHLKRLLANLIKNAIDYNRPGGTVIVSLKRNGQHIELEVRDTGMGIVVSHQVHIFDRFYKVDQARTRESSGVGLGLSIVKEIVTTHRGSIIVKSELGIGTVFHITFPAQGYPLTENFLK